MDHAAGQTAANLAGRLDANGPEDRTEPFSLRLRRRMEALDTHVCLGIDPRPERYEDGGVGAHGGDAAKVARTIAERFRAILEGTADRIACVKLQSAFFERWGVPGQIALAQLLADARALGVPAILDAKRGDVGSTAEAYADAYLGAGPFGADALTVQPYLGMDAIEPFVRAAERNARGLFVLVRTSNPGGADLQDLRLADGGTGAVTVADRLADLLTERARDSVLDAHGYGPIGAVVGATVPGALARLRARLPHALLLVPGYGAQGGGAEDVRAAFDADGHGAVISASRSLTDTGADDPVAGAVAATETMRDAIRAARDADRR